MLSVDNISGMSGSDVWRVSFQDSSVMVKCSSRVTESRFHERVAPGLREVGVSSPALEFVVTEAGRHWIVIEDVPGDASVGLGR